MEDGDRLTEEQLTELIANAEEGDGNTQLVDGGNVLTVSMEELTAVGIDVDNVEEMSAEQLANLISMSGQGKTEERVNETGTRDADSITMVIGEDGSLKLTDADNQTFFFTAEQLIGHHIDVNNLTDEHIQRIVQLAMPSLDVDKPSNSIASRKRPRDSDSTNSRLTYDHNMGTSENTSTSTTTTGVVINSPGKSTNQRTGQYSLIGQEVEVRKNGRAYPATIRYCRHGAGYKVQFEDGHFEWVSEQQIQLRTASTRGRNDHESYSGANDDSTPINRSSGLGSAGVGRRAPPAIPGIKVTPQQTETDKANGEPNFCCPICDRKVFQREPAYIVIRLPACDSCTESKILVLDQDEAT